MPSKSDEISQATGSQDVLKPEAMMPEVLKQKVDETMTRVGSSKDIARRLMKAADGTPLPHDEDDEEASHSHSHSREDSGETSERFSGKNTGGSSYGKAGRKSRGVLRRDPDDGKVEVSPDQDRGQANDKHGKDRDPADKTDGKVGKARRSGKVTTKDTMMMKKYQDHCDH